jgi:hypothetical protein
MNGVFVVFVGEMVNGFEAMGRNRIVGMACGYVCPPVPR